MTLTQAPAFAGYHHASITVSDVAASETWYCDVLGLVRAFVEPHTDESGYAVAMMRPGTHFFLGINHHEHSDRSTFDARRTGLDHLAFALSSRKELDGWVAHLDALEVDHDPLFERPGEVALVAFRDPDGVALEIIWHA